MGKHWAYSIADELNKSDVSPIVCASGISPSGIVHAGNLREVMTSYFVHSALKDLNIPTQFLFSWDDFDRLRKVPAGMPAEMANHIGKPYCDVPDPFGEYPSFAKRFENQFEEVLQQLGIEVSYKYQNEKYRAGDYDQKIISCLQKRKEVAAVIARNMTQGMTAAEIEEYYPISLYSRFTGKDTTTILNYDGESKLEYKCEETGKTDTVDITKDRIVKLAWKVDWPMRWSVENVRFEPGGEDHASPGSSYDVSSQISSEIFNFKAPHFVEYKFIRVKGATSKMSSSKGNVLSPQQLLGVYSPQIVRWIYAKINPGTPLDIALDSDVYRVYDEFDKTVSQLASGTLEGDAKTSLLLALGSANIAQVKSDFSFRNIAGTANATNFNVDKVLQVLREKTATFTTETVLQRIKAGDFWMTHFEPQMKATLRTQPNKEYWQTLPEDRRVLVRELTAVINNKTELTHQNLETALYAIAKKDVADVALIKKKQREFFKDVYQLFFGADQGPRLPTFIWCSKTEELTKLLECEN